jgi:2-polyprenyl-3-methyl-5-hydroxy-6-metoxy-1,4-benzoquinol methylase
MKVTPAIEAVWSSWLGVTTDRCHLNFELEGGHVASHIDAGIRSGTSTAERVRRDIASTQVKRVLEVGCSVGFNCFGLANIFADAEIYGIEPDSEAIEVASAMASESGLKGLHFQTGFGEYLPFDTGFFDLVVCHTVIEHVNNVDAVISEITRVMSPQGVLHLEAPNYIWPYEPHLAIWCIPLFGKKLARIFARLQNKGHQIGYLEHLKFVHPVRLERLFREHSLVWENRVEGKLDSIFSGDNHQRQLAKLREQLSHKIRVRDRDHLAHIRQRFAALSHQVEQSLQPGTGAWSESLDRVHCHT